MPSTPSLSRRASLLAIATPLCLSLGGCASWNQLPAHISSYGEWPAGRAAGGSFRFERLPSQNSQAARQAELERLALPALQAAGFKPAAEGETPELHVTLGVELGSSAYTWQDAQWATGRAGGWSLSPWAVPGWSMGMAWPSPEYRREVMILIRGANNSALYEARAYSFGPAPGNDAVLATLFRASLSDFPKTVPDIHRINVPLP